MAGSRAAKRVLVTGANKGIGLGIVKRLLLDYPECYVLLGSRDLRRGLAALKEVLGELPSSDGRIELLEIDPSDDGSVSAAAKLVASKFGTNPPPLHAVINNAGSANDDVAQLLNLNVWGPYRVDSAFIPLLRPKGGRLVQISSAAGPTFVSRCSPERQRFLTSPDITWDQITALMDEFSSISSSANTETWKRSGFGDVDSMHAYGFTKALLNAYTAFRAKEYPELLVNACTPGFIATDLTMPMATEQGKTPQELGMKTTFEGALAAVFLSMGEPKGTGWYYGSDGKRSPRDKYRSPGDPEYTGDDAQEFTGNFLSVPKSRL